MKKDKYLQIFNYLLEFSKLRSNPVRDIESSDVQYPNKVWLADIPEYDIFDCITFQKYNDEADYWLKITKPREEPHPPSFPKLSETLTDWIVKDSLTNENGLPILQDVLIKSGKTMSLGDRPEIEQEFQEYINNRWIDDLDFYKKAFETYHAKLAEHDKQGEIYKHFFSIYNKVQQFGEEYELIVGVGLLYFKEEANTPLICRHIITSKAEITFEYSAKESFVKVSPAIENEIQIETDAILDLFEQFDSANIIEAEKKLAEFIKEKNITDNPFDNQIKEAIQIFADRLSTDGQSKNDLAKPKDVPKKPTVYFAPALLLRKRNTRSFTTLYEKIIENINVSDDTIDIPSINDIVGYFENPEDLPIDSDSENPDFIDEETIYFPKKYNDEQIEIVEKARRNNKVLVQGPPGTGKSHTIANLICHLLANGKKVLVTAYTKRALEVLKNQLPDDFKNLTVNLLSGDSSSIQDLDKSVNAINDELSRITNLNKYKKEIEDKENELTSLKEDKANTKNEWVKLKEKATRKQNINRFYQGTLLEIAERIEKEAPTFSWFKDEFTDIEKIDIVSEIEDFYSLTKKYNDIDCSIFEQLIPKKEKLISLAELYDYKIITHEINQKYSSKEEHLIITSKDYSELQFKLQSLAKLFLEIENNGLLFKSKLISDYPNNISIWKNKLKRSVAILSELPDEKLKQLDRSVEIKYPKDKSLKQLRSDGETLMQLRKEGKRLRGILSIFNNPLTPINLKNKKYFIKEVQINGSFCDTTAEFETVLNDIKIKQDFEELEAIWELKSKESSVSYFNRAKYYIQLKEDAENLIGLLTEVYITKAVIESNSSIRINLYDSAKINEWIDETDYNFLNSKVKVLKERITETEKYLSIQNMHTIGLSIKENIANINIDKYEQNFLEIDTFNLAKEEFKNYKKQQIHLQKYFPGLVKEIIENSFESLNIKRLESAIYFQQAFNEISNLLAQDYETKLIYKLSELEQHEGKLLSIIASKKAWLNVLDGLNKNFLLRQHLQAWVQAVTKIGKTGKGKRALKFRKEAQLQMEKCKDSVPCWIMPLYKVAETINPEQGMYDYVIIDEASQLGADAIFLLYISKNIIIVGDDKQTSPEYVGVDANTMTPHINRYLKNIPFANYYGTEFSFFDHAKRFCNGITVLREHFRCMPEIIEFCNKHFYSPEGKGLYPLKQYSENRIEPLKSVYCQSGYVDGTYQNITNRIEAEAISNKIAEIVKDIKYKGKSIGVIGLQGNKQATIIESLIIKNIGEVEFKNRNIICGTSSSFQGDERDIMFLSLITAHNHNRIALTKPEDERRFNVAVSRAKEQVWLFHSVQLDDLSNTNDLRYKLLDHFLNYKPQLIPMQRMFERTMGTQPEPFESWFEVDVYNDIVVNGYSVIPQYEVAKGRYRIDLVALLSNGIKIAIECDGDKYHSAEQFQNDLLRQKVLERCGWQFFRVRGAEYYTNRKKSLYPLWKLLKSNDSKATDIISAIKHIYEDTDSISNEYSEKINFKKTDNGTKEFIHKNVEQRDLFKKGSQTGIDFKPKDSLPVEPNDQIELSLSVNGINARAVKTKKGFMVLHGSEASNTKVKEYLPYGNLKLRDDLINDGTLVLERDRYIFTKDYYFDSSSQAAKIITCSSISGPQIWRDANGKTLKQIEE